MRYTVSPFLPTQRSNLRTGMADCAAGRFYNVLHDMSQYSLTILAYASRYVLKLMRCFTALTASNSQLEVEVGFAI